jgi:hypothetical protein
MTGSVFISYRREDSAGYARAIYNALRERLGKASVFMDVDTIEPGLDFIESIENAVGKCEVLLAIIGPRWLSEEAESMPRLFEEIDYVRSEIRTALERNVRVIPVLVGGATMPSGEALPDDLKTLIRRNAIEIRHTHFDSDVASLIDVLARVVHAPSHKQAAKPHEPPAAEAPAAPHQASPASQNSRRRWLAQVALLLLFVAAGFFYTLYLDDLRIHSGSSDSYQTVYRDDALVAASITTAAGYLITLLAGWIGRRQWWTGLLLGLAFFAALGFGMGILWLIEVLNVRYEDDAIISGIMIGAFGLIVILGRAILRRSSA